MENRYVRICGFWEGRVLRISMGLMLGSLMDGFKMMRIMLIGIRVQEISLVKNKQEILLTAVLINKLTFSLQTNGAHSTFLHQFPLSDQAVKQSPKYVTN